MERNRWTTKAINSLELDSFFAAVKKLSQPTRTVYFGVLITTGEHNNPNQIWCVNRGEYTFFGSIVGSHYYI